MDQAGRQAQLPVGETKWIKEEGRGIVSFLDEEQEMAYPNQNLSEALKRWRLAFVDRFNKNDF